MVALGAVQHDVGTEGGLDVGRVAAQGPLYLTALVPQVPWGH